MFVAGLTNTGIVREQNQDAIVCSLNPVGIFPNLFIVADGMGGHNSGDIASEMAIDIFCAYLRNPRVARLIEPDFYLDLLITAAMKANKKVYDKSLSAKKYRGMGTTFTACSIVENKAYIVHVGDSRLYTIAPGHIVRITTDHNYVEEMLKMGAITPEDAKDHPNRNMVTNVLGVDPNVKIDGLVQDLTDVSMILICSDGLTNMLSDDEILEIVYGKGFVMERAETLVKAANKQGGSDNISVILISIQT